MNAPESFRCPHCEALLDTPTRIEAGECGCQHESGDIRLSHTGTPFVAIYNRYARTCEWVELIPAGGTQSTVPRGPLLARDIDGKRLPVTDLGTGDLYSVRPVA